MAERNNRPVQAPEGRDRGAAGWPPCLELAGVHAACCAASLQRAGINPAVSSCKAGRAAGRRPSRHPPALRSPRRSRGPEGGRAGSHASWLIRQLRTAWPDRTPNQDAADPTLLPSQARTRPGSVNCRRAPAGVLGTADTTWQWERPAPSCRRVTPARTGNQQRGFDRRGNDGQRRNPRNCGF